jgi:hypothetical protein
VQSRHHGSHQRQYQARPWQSQAIFWVNEKRRGYCCHPTQAYADSHSCYVSPASRDHPRFEPLWWASGGGGTQQLYVAQVAYQPRTQTKACPPQYDSRDKCKTIARSTINRYATLLLIFEFKTIDFLEILHRLICKL